MLANYFFFSILFFILGVISFYFFKFWFIFSFFSLFFKRPTIILILFLSFILGGLYGNLREILNITRTTNEIKILKIYSPTHYQRYQGMYSGKEYIIYAPYYSNFYIGDKIIGNYRIYENKIFLNKVTEIKKSKFSFIYKIKEKINGLIRENYSINSSEIISGILYGEEIKQKDLKDALKNSGLSHITAMSGFNLTLISNILFNFLKFTTLSIFSINIISLVFILIFIIFTNFQASVIRAGIMTAILIICKSIGRIPLNRNIICFSILLILIFTPKAIISDLGFQLSFLAIIGILYLEEYFRRFLKYKVFSETISAQIMVVPLLWYKFGELNLFSFFSNIIFIPFIPFLMILGFLALLFYFLHPINQILNIPFELFTFLVNIFSKIPKIYIPAPLFLTIILYIFLSFLIYKINRDEKIDFNFALY